MAREKFSALTEQMLYVLMALKSDKCGTEMEFTGMALTSYPMQYPHMCPKCDYRETHHVIYPTIRYEEID